MPIGCWRPLSSRTRNSHCHGRQPLPFVAPSSTIETTVACNPRPASAANKPRSVFPLAGLVRFSRKARNWCSVGPSPHFTISVPHLKFSCGTPSPVRLPDCGACSFSAFRSFPLCNQSSVGENEEPARLARSPRQKSRVPCGQSTRRIERIPGPSPLLSTVTRRPPHNPHRMF